MAFDGSAVSFDEAFSELIKFLTTAFQNGRLVSLPPQILQPFRRSQPTAADAEALRPLLKLLEGKNKKNGIRLAPRSFYTLFNIVLQFPHTRVQEKLLYTLLNVVLLYKDDTGAAAELARISGEPVPNTAVQDGRRFICIKLAHQAVSVLQQEGLQIRARRVAAHILVHLCVVDSDATLPVIRDDNCQVICDAFRATSDSVLRFVIADLIRSALSQSEHKYDFSSCGLSTEILRDLGSDQQWLKGTMNGIADLDATRSVKERELIFRLDSLRFDDEVYNSAGDSILAVMSSSLVFVLPSSADGPISTIEVPFQPDMTVDETELVVAESDGPSLQIIAVGLPPNGGDRYFQGVKKAIDRFYVELHDPMDQSSFISSIQEKSTEQISLETSTPPVAASSPSQLKRAVDIMDITWNSEDDAWTRCASPRQMGFGTSTHGKKKGLYEKLRRQERLNDTPALNMHDQTPTSAADDQDSPTPRLSQGPSGHDQAGVNASKSSEAEFALKLNSMLGVAAFRDEGRNHPQTRSIRRAPFGNREKFVANVNATKNIPLRRSVRAKDSKQTPAGKLQVSTSHQHQKDRTAAQKVRREADEVAELPPTKRVRLREKTKSPPQNVVPASTPTTFTATLQEGRRRIEERAAIERDNQNNRNEEIAFTLRDHETTLVDSFQQPEASASPDVDAGGLFEPDLEGTPVVTHVQSKAAPEQILRRTLHGLADLVVSRLRREDDIVGSTLTTYQEQAKALVNRFHDTWTGRVEHERQTLTTLLRAEQKEMQKAVDDIQQNDAELQKCRIDEKALELIDEAKQSLTSAIRAIPT